MAKRFRDEDEITLMQLIAAVTKLHDIEQSEAMLCRELDDRTNRIRSRFDDEDSHLIENTSRATQNSNLLAINIDLQKGRSVERKAVDSLCLVRSYLVNHMTDASVGLRVSVMPLWITLDQQMQGIRIRGNQRFGLLRNADIDDGGNTDSGQAAEGVAFCRCVHRRIISKAMTVIEAA